MRINKFIASSSNLSRRAADQAVVDGRVLVNGQPPSSGQDIGDSDQVTLDGRTITPAGHTVTIMLNKPVGYVVSRNGQGAPTIYDLLPAELQHLQPVGRLDKDSSGLLLLTNDGQLAQQLTHPSYQKNKVYEIKLNQPLAAADQQLIERGLALDDGLSRLQLAPLSPTNWQVTMQEGRNRQIRRTFSKLGYKVTALHRTSFGEYNLGNLAESEYGHLS